MKKNQEGKDNRLVSFYTRASVMFSGGIEKDQCYDMGYTDRKTQSWIEFS